jgi:hypothetical protein
VHGLAICETGLIPGDIASLALAIPLLILKLKSDCGYIFGKRLNRSVPVCNFESKLFSPGLLPEFAAKPGRDCGMIRRQYLVGFLP